VTAPMAPAPVPPPQDSAPVQAPPGQVPPPPADAPTESPAGGGESATDAAAGDPMAWLAAAEMDARYEVVERPTTQNGLLGE